MYKYEMSFFLNTTTIIIHSINHISMDGLLSFLQHKSICGNSFKNVNAYLP